MSDGSGERPITVAVIGVGRIGRLHAETLARRVPGVRLGPVYDVRTPLAADVASDFGVPRAAGVEQILSSDVDAVAICSSSNTHVELMIAAAEAGKAILCEHRDRQLAPRRLRVRPAGRGVRIGGSACARGLVALAEGARR